MYCMHKSQLDRFSACAYVYPIIFCAMGESCSRSALTFPMGKTTFVVRVDVFEQQKENCGLAKYDETTSRKLLLN